MVFTTRTRSKPTFFSWRCQLEEARKQIAQLKDTNRKTMEQGAALYKKFTALKDEKAALEGAWSCAWGDVSVADCAS